MLYQSTEKQWENRVNYTLYMHKTVYPVKKSYVVNKLEQRSRYSNRTFNGELL